MEIEDIVLKHSARGINVLRKFMPESYAMAAAKEILGWERKVVFLATGFYVAGYAETDGPAGTVFLAKALKKLGFKPVIVTDKFCHGFFEPEEIDVLFMPFDAGKEWCEFQLELYKPVGLISIERCGKNSDGKYANMQGINISDKTVKIDIFFENVFGRIPSIGVGDGGNEIGMGNVAGIIKNNLELEPCIVKVDNLVIATVSNWGAYAIIAWLEKLSGESVFMSFEEVEEFIKSTVEIGSVDGVLKQKVVSVDGFGMEIEKEIIQSLRMAI